MGGEKEKEPQNLKKTHTALFWRALHPQNNYILASVGKIIKDPVRQPKMEISK